MIWFVIIPIIVFIIALVYNCEHSSWPHTPLLDSIAITFMAVLLGSIPGLIGYSISAPDTYQSENAEVIHIEQYDIHALQDNFAIEGSKFLFSGYVDEEMRYYFIKSDALGNKEIDYLDADQASIDDTLAEGEQPYIEKISYKNKSVIADWLAYNVPQEYIIIHIPKGSTTSDINIDLIERVK